jgi:hypothetical protein
VNAATGPGFLDSRDIHAPQLPFLAWNNRGLDLSGKRANAAQVVRLRLAESDGGDGLDEGALTDVEKVLIEERCRGLEAKPQASAVWDGATPALLKTAGRGRF